MFNINLRLQCLKTCLSAKIFAQLTIIITAMLSMTGRVTMLGISRWTGKCGSYRTVQRFFNTAIEWYRANWTLIRHYSLSKDDVFIIAGDENVATKSGEKTYGIDRFFSSLYDKVVPSLSFFTISLISTKLRTSFPILIQQTIRSEEKTNAENSKLMPTEDRKQTTAEKKHVGRPKGSKKNKNKENVDLPPHLCSIQSMLEKVKKLIGNDIPLIYVVFDGAFGNNNALQMVKQCGLNLISKLHYNSALYFPYSGKNSGRGARKKYGNKFTIKIFLKSI